MKKMDKFYRRKDCIQNFCRDLKELVTEIINYKEKEMTALTSHETTLYESQKIYHIYKGYFCTDENKKKEFKLSQNVGGYCHYTGKFRESTDSICKLRYKVPKKIPIVFLNALTCDDHFISKQLAEDFKGQFECLGENTVKYIIFSVPIKEDHNSKKITYKLRFIDSYRFMQSKLSDHVDNLTEIYSK